MTGQILLLFAGLVAILVAADGFTNRIETLGSRLSLSQAVVGSILAAVGTALPETVLPFVAIFLYGGSSAHEIGVGAILGAPFMLSTLAFFLVGLTSIISHQKKQKGLRDRLGDLFLKKGSYIFPDYVFCRYSFTLGSG